MSTSSTNTSLNGQNTVTVNPAIMAQVEALLAQSELPEEARAALVQITASANTSTPTETTTGSAPSGVTQEDADKAKKKEQSFRVLFRLLGGAPYNMDRDTVERYFDRGLRHTPTLPRDLRIASRNGIHASKWIDDTMADSKAPKTPKSVTSVTTAIAHLRRRVTVLMQNPADRQFVPHDELVAICRDLGLNVSAEVPSSN